MFQFPCFTLREAPRRAPGNHITPAEHSHRRTSGTSCSTAFCPRSTSDEPMMMSEKSWQKAERGKTQASFRPHPSSIRLIHIVFIHYIYLLVPFVSIEHFSSFVCLFHTCQKIPIQAKMLQSSWFFHVLGFIFLFSSDNPSTHPLAASSSFSSHPRLLRQALAVSRGHVSTLGYFPERV